MRRRSTVATLRTLNYGNYGIFLTMGNAGFILSTVALLMLIRNVDPNPNLHAPAPHHRAANHHATTGS